ncbi:MAG: hypothetical protein ACRD0K_29195 [Egibacteraceae bacterium]
MAKSATYRSYKGPTFFDYCFARRFVGSLAQLLGPAETQGLFVRSQVRQLLAFERETDPDRYRRDLRWLLEPGHIRLHLRDVVLALVGQQADPRADEWEILARIAEQPPSPADDALWRAIRSNPAWFPLIDATGAWEPWLLSPDERVINRAAWALSGLLPAFPDRVVELVSPFVSVPDVWQRRLFRLLLTANLQVGRPVIDLLLRLIPTGVADQASELTYPLGQLAAREPVLAVEVIEALLRRDLDHPRNTEDAKPFALAAQPLGGHHGGSDLMTNAAQGAPGEFLQRLLPIALAVMELHEEPGNRDDSIADAVWSSRIYGAGNKLSDHIYNGITVALETLASSDPDAVAPHLAALRSSRRTSALWLLARAYRAGAAAYADAAVDWLCGDPAALRLGYLDSPHWVSRELIEAVTPMCTQPALARLCATLLGYTPAWEMRPEAGRFRGSAQLCLLGGIDPARRSPQVERRLGELRRKLGRNDGSPPQGVQAGWVKSPIEPEKTKRMTGEQWLGAIARYDSDRFTWGEDGRKGGADQLAQELEARAKEDPDRFARLVVRIPSTAPSAYISAVLRGIGTSPLDQRLLVAACLAGHERRNSAVGRELVRLIEQRAADPLPEKLLRIVAHCATEDPDPTRDVSGSDIDSAGLNSTRGAAARSVWPLIQRDTSRLGVLFPSLTHALNDPVLAVRACAIGGLIGVLVADPDMAVERFVQAIEQAPDELLSSHHVERFVYWAASTHLDEVLPTLRRMTSSPDAVVASAGAGHLALASLGRADLDAAVDELLTGGPAQRRGVVASFAENVAYEPRRARILDVLSRAFNDPEPQIRSDAQRCFWKLSDTPLPPYRSLFQAYADSPATKDKFTTVFQTLKTSCGQLPDTALMLCEQWLDAHGDEAGDIATHAAAEAHQVSAVLLRLYTQHNDDPDLRRRCLDLIDAMITVGAHGMPEQLTSIDR